MLVSRSNNIAIGIGCKKQITCLLACSTMVR